MFLSVTYMVQYSTKGFPKILHGLSNHLKFKITSSKSKLNNINRFMGHNQSSEINK